MRIAISDTGPINYLILTGHGEVLPKLFERILIASAVQSELSAQNAPSVVQAWIKNPPGWLEIVDCPAVPSVPGIHRGEAAAIALANSIPDSLLLMDDRRGVRAARELGLQVTGTLGIPISPRNEDSSISLARYSRSNGLRSGVPAICWMRC